MPSFLKSTLRKIGICFVLYEMILVVIILLFSTGNFVPAHTRRIESNIRDQPLGQTRFKSMEMSADRTDTSVAQQSGGNKIGPLVSHDLIFKTWVSTQMSGSVYAIIVALLLGLIGTGLQALWRPFRSCVASTVGIIFAWHVMNGAALNAFELATGIQAYLRFTTYLIHIMLLL